MELQIFNVSAEHKKKLVLRPWTMLAQFLKYLHVVYHHFRFVFLVRHHFGLRCHTNDTAVVLLFCYFLFRLNIDVLVPSSIQSPTIFPSKNRVCMKYEPCITPMISSL